MKNKKNMKKWFLLVSFAAASVFAFWFTYKFSEYGEIEQAKITKDQWQTYAKIDKKINSYPTTQTEKEKSKLGQLAPLKKQATKEKRAPAAINPSYHPSYQDRRIIGMSPDMNSASISANISSEKLKAVNKVSDYWEQRLGDELMRFQPPQTKVFVKKEFSLLRVLSSSQFQYVEQVLVHFQSPDGKHSSFKAYIDSSNGQVLSTWARTIHEPLNQAGEGQEGLTPTGEL